MASSSMSPRGSGPPGRHHRRGPGSVDSTPRKLEPSGAAQAHQRGHRSAFRDQRGLIVRLGLTPQQSRNRPSQCVGDSRVSEQTTLLLILTCLPLG